MAAPKAVATFAQQFQIAAPLFALVLIGYLLSRWGRWSIEVSAALSKFVFAVALPALLFRLMSGLAALPPVDPKLLLAYFGGCVLVFVLGRGVARYAFRLDGVGQSVFALGGIFSNNVLLGVPLARSALGEAAMPAVALVLVFNTLLLWTLVTVSVEWARHGELSLKGFRTTARSVLTNPIVASIMAGSIFGLAGGRIPALIDEPLRLLGDAATPLALFVLGMGLSEYGVRQGWREGIAITVLKLVGPATGRLGARASAATLADGDPGRGPARLPRGGRECLPDVARVPFHGRSRRHEHGAFDGAGCPDHTAGAHADGLDTP